MSDIVIIIRTKNEAEYLGTTLAAIRRQTVANHEVIVIDSGSTDDTCAIAADYGTRLLAIRPEDFSYGRALNLAIEQTRAPLVASLSAHATPAADDWLEYLAAGFADPRIGAVYGRHLPRDNATRLERFGMRLSGTLSDKRRYQSRSIGFSNANGAFRRTLWERFPFDENLPGAEDFAWAREIQRRGFVILYEPRAAVYHSHGESLGSLLRRARRDQPVILRSWFGRLKPATAQSSRRRVALRQIQPEP